MTIGENVLAGVAVVTGITTVVTLIVGCMNADYATTVTKKPAFPAFVRTICWPLLIWPVVYRELARTWIPRCDKCNTRVRVRAKYCHHCSSKLHT